MNKQSAKQATEFIQVLNRDREGRASVVSVPGHQGRRYTVILKRKPGGHFPDCELAVEEDDLSIEQ
jgi:hypothetical protein